VIDKSEKAILFFAISWRDGVTLGVAAFSGIAMTTGVGEIAVGIGAIGWDIVNAMTDKKE
jgi:hypothetical protein